jgi:hypothetical protein
VVGRSTLTTTSGAQVNKRLQRVDAAFDHDAAVGQDVVEEAGR